MDPETTSNNAKQFLIAQLQQFGFDQFYILKAVQLTTNKEKAAQIVMKLVEQGPNADLSMYQPPPPSQQQPPQQSTGAVEGTMMMPVVEEVRPNRAKMIFVVNGALKMGKGKICAQVGHAVIGAYLQIQETVKWDERDRLRLHSWENSGGAKIVVRANNLKQMIDVQTKLKKADMGINMYLVQDAGHTQIEAGSKTVLAIGPAFSNQIDPFTEHFKLL